MKLIPKLPTLYKKNSKGKMMVWFITIKQVSKSHVVIEKTYGELDGKLQKKPYDVIGGLNVGKKNETTTLEQAYKEALSKWKKQKNSGYVESTVDAEAGKEDESIQGGILPMLAKTYEDNTDKVEYPCYVQPKLDGMRCIAVIEDGLATLWSRQRKPITSCPHIVKDLEHVASLNWEFQNCILDGELYNHDLAEEFEQIMSAVKKKQATLQAQMIEFHIYDGFKFGQQISSYSLRYDYISNIPDWATESLQVVTTTTAFNEEEVKDLRNTFIENSYEGLMIRNCNGVYKSSKTRSDDLLKMKLWKDDEFDIVNVLKKKDNTVVFVLKTKEGVEFEATKSGNKIENQKYLKNSTLWIGKKMNVKYFKFTKKNNVPKMGEARYIRED